MERANNCRPKASKPYKVGFELKKKQRDAVTSVFFMQQKYGFSKKRIINKNKEIIFMKFISFFCLVNLFFF